MTDTPQGSGSALARTRHMEVQHFADGGVVRTTTDRYYPSTSAPRLGLKNGGLVKGPGTGTSDSIPRDLPVGSFIMPADSTAALGVKNLEQMIERVPAMVSNGEYEVTPEEVHGLGVAVLSAMKDATHEHAKGRGARLGVQRKADGGMVEDPAQRAPGLGLVTRVGNSYSGGNVSGPVSINGQAPGGTFSSISAGPPPAVQPPPAAPVAPAPAAVKPMFSAASGVGRPNALGSLADTNAQIASIQASNPGFGLRRPATPAPAAAAPSPGLGLTRPTPTPTAQPTFAAYGGVAPPSPPAAAPAPPSAPAPAPAPPPEEPQRVVAYRDGGAVRGAQPAQPGFGLDRRAARRAYADGGLVDDEEARRREAAAAAPQSGGAVFGLYPQLAGDARTYGLANRLRQGVTASSGAEGQTFVPAVAVAPPAPVATAPAPSAQRLNATTDPRSTLFKEMNRPATAPAEPLPTSAPAVAAPAPAPSYPAAGGVTVLPDATDTAGQLNRDIAHQQDLQRLRNPSDPTPGVTVIGADFANRNAEFNEGAALRTAAARGSWSPRRGFQGDDAAVAAALTPIQLRAQATRAAQAQAGETTRALIAERGTEARAKIADAQNQEQNAIARRRLEIDAVRASRDGLPVGYKRTADGNLTFEKGGPADPETAKGKNTLTEGQSKALLFGSRMQASNKILDDLQAAGKVFSTPGANTPYIGGVVNLVNSEQGQQLDQAKRDFLNATLRRESGAVISPAEFDNGDRQYFPQPGDSPKVIEQKKQNRQVAMRGILAEVPNADQRSAAVLGPAQPPAAAAATSTPSAVPAGMSRQVGTSGGKPVYEDAQGRRFIGG